MPRLFVVDSWFFEDLKGANGEAAWREATFFWQAAFSKKDKLVIAKNEQAHQKMFEYVGASYPILMRDMAKNMFANFLHDREAIHLIEPNKLPALSAVRVRKYPADDHFLVRSYLAMNKPETLIITTDQPLMKIMLAEGKIKFAERNEFIASYNSS